MSTALGTSPARPRSASGGRHAVAAIRLDAAVSGASGAAVAAGAPLLDGLLGAPAAFLVPLGTLLLGYAGALVLVARAGAPKALVGAVVVGNALWVAASVAVVVADVLTLTMAGAVVTLLQAAAVAGLAALQLWTLRAASE